MITKVNVYRDQNIVDLSLQEYGSIEGIVEFAKQNGLSVDGDPVVNTLVDIDSEDIVSTSNRTFYKTLDYLVASGRDYTSSEGGGIFDESFDETFE